jgi:hypothetical protein
MTMPAHRSDASPNRCRRTRCTTARVGGWLLPALALASPAAPAQSLPPTGEATSLFATYCVAHFGSSGEGVDARLDADRAALKMDARQSAPFLDNAPGKAWTFKTAQSQYVVALTDSAGCYLYAIRGDRDAAWADFDTLTGALFKPWSAVALLPTSMDRDGASHQNSKSIYYTAPATAPTPAFFITTDYSDAPNNFAIRLKIQFAEKALLDLLKTGAEQHAQAQK